MLRLSANRCRPNRLCQLCDAVTGLWCVFIVIGCMLSATLACADDGADQILPAPDFAVIEIKLTPTHQREPISFTVKLAETERQRRHGLMFVSHLPERHGMLFVFKNDALRQFWMKNTLISLDILFSSYDGRIIKIFENVPKLTEKKVTAGDGVSFVLEINSGLVEEFEIDASWIMNFTDFFEATKPFC